jgi:hypothetical protein
MTDVYEFSEYDRLNLIYNFTTMTPAEVETARAKVKQYDEEQAVKKAAAAAQAAAAKAAAPAATPAVTPPTVASPPATSTPPAAAPTPEPPKNDES